MVMNFIYFSIGNRAFEFFKYVLESINPSTYFYWPLDQKCRYSGGANIAI